MFDRRIVVGLALGTASAVLGGAWQVATRLATTTTIVPGDLALLRYGIPAAVLLPLVLRVGLLPRHVARRHLALMVLGAGLPFGLVAMSGTRFAPSAHMGVLMAGASPLFAAALAWLLWRERPDRSRRAGFVLMLLGVALLGSKSSTAAEAQAWIGDALFLLAAGMWAGFTLSFRRAGLTPWQGAALVNVWSALLLLPWLVWRGALGLIDAPAHDILLQALWQGVLAGLLGLWMYSAAIARLGAANAAAFAALAPAVSALGGWLVLGDHLGVLEITAVLAAAAGVALASGALSFAISRPRSRFPATARCGDARTAPAPPRPE